MAFKTKLSVAFSHFPYGGNGACSSEHPDIRRWEVETVLKMKQDDRIQRFATKDYSDTPITMTRNRALRKAREDGFDLLLMVDSDQSPDRHAGESWFKPFWDEGFNFLYENYHNGPRLIFAPYCGPPNDETGGENIYVFQWRNMANLGPETPFSLEQYTREQASIMSGIHEAAAGPTGMLMIDLRLLDLIEPSKLSKREVFEAVQAGHMSVDQAILATKDGYCYYEWKDGYADQKASTEDVTLTRDIAIAGVMELGYNPVFCAWDSWIGHHKPWNVGKPQRFTSDDVGAVLQRAALRGRKDREVIIDLGSRLSIGAEIEKALGQQARFTVPAIDHKLLVEEHKSNGSNSHIEKPHWAMCKSAIALVKEAAKGKKLIVDVGPGNLPIPIAHEFVGRRCPKTNYPGKFHEIDLDKDRLPYADQSVDFLYCRHTIEDLANPEHLLSEIRRVAKAGYIETPSPLAESTEGVDAPDSAVKGRGYCHHRSVVWCTSKRLYVLPKMPHWNKLELPKYQDHLNIPEMWNAYHLWEGVLDYQVLANEKDYLIGIDDRYQTWAATAIEQSRSHTGLLFGMFDEPKVVKHATHTETSGPWFAHGHAPDEHKKVLAELVLDLTYKRGGPVRVLEAGTWLGGTAMAMADATKFGTVHCVDTWAGTPTDITGEMATAAGGPECVYDEFLKRIGNRLNTKIFPWPGTSAMRAAQEWQQFDLIFIDADHTYEGCKADILGWWKHLADDGVMVGHDFYTNGCEGVVQAVLEIFGDKHAEIGKTPQGSLWLVEKQHHPELMGATSGAT